MTWDFRWIEHDEGSETYVAIHEVHYGVDGTIRGWAELPRELMAESADDLMWILDEVRQAYKKPTLRWTELVRTVEGKN